MHPTIIQLIVFLIVSFTLGLYVGSALFYRKVKRIRKDIEDTNQRIRDCNINLALTRDAIERKERGL